MRKVRNAFTVAEGATRRFQCWRLVFLAVCTLMPSPVDAQTYVKLYTWYSSERGDHFTTSDPRWAGTPGTRRDSYYLLDVAGQVFNPNALQRPGSVPLFSFWHPTRRDNFITSDPQWTSVVSRDGYRRYRLEGYILQDPVAGTVPLINFWNAAKSDNYASSDPFLRLAVGSEIPPNILRYTAAGAIPVELLPARRLAGYRSFRTEGYVIGPALEEEMRTWSYGAALRAVGYEYRRPRAPGGAIVVQGPGAPTTAPRVETPVIVMAHAFADLTFTADELQRYGRLLDSDVPPSVNRYIDVASNGKYRWRPAGFVSVSDPLRFSQFVTDVSAMQAVINGTQDAYQRTNGFGVQVFDIDGDGRASLDELQSRTRMLMFLNQQGVDFASFDANRDGRVDRTELQVVRFGADPGNGGQRAVSRDIRLDGVQVQTDVLFVAKDTSMTGVAHELMHAWDGLDLYGPALTLNLGATLMAALQAGSLFVLPDPWHTIQWGWTQARFFPIGSASGGSSQAFRLSSRAAGGRGNPESMPLVLYDPVRGFSEYFALEYRTPFPKCPSSGLPNGGCPTHADNATGSYGLAVWHVVMTDTVSFQPVIVPQISTSSRFWRPAGVDGAAPWLGAVMPPTALIGGSGQWSGSRFWQESDGPIDLRWRDGSSTGIRLHVGSLSEYSSFATVEWMPSTLPFRPRIDRIGAASFDSTPEVRIVPGQALSIDGVFGVRRDERVVGIITAMGGRQRVQITSWAPGRILFTVPSTLGAGSYSLVVGDATSFDSGRIDRLSNAMRFRVAP